MNNNFKDGSIGTDPTRVPIIETLDVVPKQEKQKNGNNLIKKIIFTIVIVLLMGGVAFGVYYYLNLGQKNKKAANFTLNDVTVILGKELSTNIKDYGVFNDVDINDCKLDLSNVDNTKEGSYSYSVKCYQNKKEANIIVVATNNFKVTTKMINRDKDTKVLESNLVKTTDEYTYSFINIPETKIGINVYTIDIKNSEEKHQTVYGFVNILPVWYSSILECSYGNVKYRVFFNSSDNKIGNVIKLTDFTYKDENEMITDIFMIKDGKLSKNNVSGYAIVDYDNLTIRIANDLSDALLDTDYPKTKTDIKTYYERLNYNCEIK